MSTPAKLYIAVRGDLSPGLQLAQAVHAAFQFANDHRQMTARWLMDSNYLVVVNVPDEAALFQLITEASFGRGLDHTVVYEPDLGDEATAVALQPGEEARALCSSLPLALRERCLMQ